MTLSIIDTHCPKFRAKILRLTIPPGPSKWKAFLAKMGTLLALPSERPETAPERGAIPRSGIVVHRRVIETTVVPHWCPAISYGR
jgi:hypothetical protein